MALKNCIIQIQNTMKHAKRGLIPECNWCIDQGWIGCLKLDRALFIHPLSKSLFFQVRTVTRKHCGILYVSLSVCFLVKSSLQLSFQPHFMVCSLTSQLGRYWERLGAFILVLLTTHLPSQWFIINPWTSEM